MDNENSLRGVIFFLATLCLFSIGTTLWVVRENTLEQTRIASLLQSQNADLAVQEALVSPVEPIPAFTASDTPTGNVTTGPSALLASDVAKHNTANSCWIIISRKVYDVTRFIKSHPGGENSILTECGTDATKSYQTKGLQPARSHMALADNMLPTYYVGEIGKPTSVGVKAGTETPPAPKTATPAPKTVTKAIPSEPIQVTSTLPKAVPGTETVNSNPYNTAGVATHNSQGNCWLTISGKIYDVTGFLSSHPGGVSTITPWCGKESTNAFANKGGGGSNHSAFAYSMLPTYYVADLVTTTTPTPTPTPTPTTDTTLPTVSITSPVSGTSFPAGQSVTISASAGDTSGIARVEFLVDNNILTTDTTSPYNTTWNATAGTHSIIARAVDGSSAQNSSQTGVTVTVTATTPAPTPTVTTYTTSQIAAHNTSADCWIVIMGKIYSVASYINSHPGGRTAISTRCGTDVTTAFTTNGAGGHAHRASTYNILPTYYVGDLGTTPSPTPNPTPTPTPVPTPNPTPTPAPTPSTPQTVTVTVNSSGVFGQTSLTIKTGDSVQFNYTSGLGEAKVRFSPTTISGFTLDEENNSRTRTFNSASTWTATVEDKSAPSLTITVQ